MGLAVRTSRSLCWNVMLGMFWSRADGSNHTRPAEVAKDDEKLRRLAVKNLSMRSVNSTSKNLLQPRWGELAAPGYVSKGR
jgi:hypothetical protein